MSILWPVDVPQKALIDGYNEENQSILAEFKPEIGMPLLSRRASEEVEQITFQTIMTMDQYEELKDWRRNTLKSGALPFQRYHPRNSAVLCTCLFTSLSAPVIISNTKCVATMQMMFTIDG